MFTSHTWIFSTYRFTWVNNVRSSDAPHSALLHNLTSSSPSPPSTSINITWIYFGEIILTPPARPVQTGGSFSAVLVILLLNTQASAHKCTHLVFHDLSKSSLIFKVQPSVCVWVCVCVGLRRRGVLPCFDRWVHLFFFSSHPITEWKLISRFRRDLWTLGSGISIQPPHTHTHTHTCTDSEPQAAMSVLS